MSDPLKNLAPGDALPTSVRTWNPILEMARNNRQARQPSVSPDQQLRYPDCMVRNQSAELMPQFAPGLIDNTVEIEPDARGFFSTPVLHTDLPAGTETSIVIAVQPIPAGKLGPAWLMGLVPATIDVTDAGHGYVKPKAGEFMFESSATAGWPILWKQAGTGTLFGYVLIGAGVGGSGCNADLTIVEPQAGDLVQIVRDGECYLAESRLCADGGTSSSVSSSAPI